MGSRDMDTSGGLLCLAGVRRFFPCMDKADAKTRFSMVRHKYVFVGSRPFSQCWRISVGKGGCKVAQTESGQWSWLTSALRF